MNRQTIARSVLAATIATSMLFAPFAFAEGDIVKCTGADGRVTLTDSACQAGESSVTVVTGAVPVLASADVPAPRTVRTARERTPGDAARKALARLDPPSRSLGRDVATLKAAHQAMQLMDSAASAMKARRIAGLH